MRWAKLQEKQEGLCFSTGDSLWSQVHGDLLSGTATLGDQNRISPFDETTFTYVLFTTRGAQVLTISPATRTDNL